MQKSLTRKQKEHLEYWKYAIDKEKKMEEYIKEWCKRHRATLIRKMKEGFVYMLDNGSEYYIEYDEM